jgi:peptidoglycan hydrolase CwlO-like protein
MSDVKRYKASTAEEETQLNQKLSDSFVLAADFDAAQAELAALREELDTITAAAKALRDEWRVDQQRLTAAEQRNAELVELLTSIKLGDPDKQYLSYPMHRRIDAALKSTESGASA